MVICGINRKISLLIISIIILLASWLPAIAEPSVSATSAVLIDGQTGKVLWSKNPHLRRPIASTTKIMTGLMTIENLSPEEVVTADTNTEKTAESEIYLKKNEKMSVSDLLYALMLQSANDAAVALANHISGSVPKFAIAMNKKAEILGLVNTNFKNPHGLYDANTSSAYDMALLGKAAMDNKIFAGIVKTKSAVINGKTKRKVINRNKLLWQYPLAVGIKTGYTKAAGYCLVSAAKKDEMLLIAATLNSPGKNESFDNAKSLFEYGFSQLKYFSIAKKGQIKAEIDVPFSFEKMKLKADEDFGVVSTKNAKIKTKVSLRKTVNLPIKKGDTLGQLKVFEGKKLLLKKNLVATKNVDEVEFLAKITFWLKSFAKRLINI